MNVICEITIGEIFTIIVLIITAWIVWLYTKAAQKTNEIQEQPVLNLSLHGREEAGSTRYALKVKNVGRAPAYNIVFSSLIAGEYKYHPLFRNKNNPVLEVEEEQDLYFWVHIEPNITEAYDRTLGFEWFLQRFFPHNTPIEERENLKRSSAVFVINYDGISGQRYHSVFRVYSKIWSLSGIYDLVCELIQIGKGDIKRKEATSLCAEKETIPKFLVE